MIKYQPIYPSSVPKEQRVDVARRVKRWRKHYGLTQERAAEILRVSIKTVQDYEQGRRGQGLHSNAYRWLFAQTKITKEPRDFSKPLEYKRTGKPK
jgi:transcriptional regulator with XRE-family HTH domain